MYTANPSPWSFLSEDYPAGRTPPDERPTFFASKPHRYGVDIVDVVEVGGDYALVSSHLNIPPRGVAVFNLGKTHGVYKTGTRANQEARLLARELGHA